MERKLHLDILILILMLKIYLFWYSERRDRQRNLSGVGFPHYAPPGTPAAHGLKELFLLS
jgi:hypothetical protein